ncbi:hypothetical protein [Prauserella flavalba]|uniref:hypothetical protein n=1 Tax=Prauserella flavalba TaxID=1477506 RepID=UPI0036EE2747
MGGERRHAAPGTGHAEASSGRFAPTTTAVAEACQLVSFVVIAPDGTLKVRTVQNRVRLDEWDTPYQETLWAAVRREVDPHYDAVNGMPLQDDLRVKVADLAGQVPDLYPPNPVASAVLTTLGHQPRYWFGTIAIVGAEDADGITASLTADQLEIITKGLPAGRVVLTQPPYR